MTPLEILRAEQDTWLLGMPVIDMRRVIAVTVRRGEWRITMMAELLRTHPAYLGRVTL